MTALREFARLETTGLWRPAPDAQRRDVVVSFGDATLVIADGGGRPLSHWSLAALVRTNPGEMPAIYCPDGDTTEALELDDATMIAAIEKVRGAIDRARPRPGLLRRGGGWAAAAAVTALAVFWLPGALTRQTLQLVPDPTRSEIGATLVGLMQRQTGPACRTEAGSAALDHLTERLFGAGSGLSVVVLPDGPLAPQVLPGGIIVLPRAALEGTEDPLVLAGTIVATLAGAHGTDPLRGVLEAAGLGATLRLLATGSLGAETLAPQAAALLTAEARVPETEALLAAFAAAGLPSSPWAAAGGAPEGAATALIAGDPLAGAQAAPVLSDPEWLSLQAICGA